MVCPYILWLFCGDAQFAPLLLTSQADATATFLLLIIKLLPRTQ
jgi:hypothetical protein